MQEYNNPSGFHHCDVMMFSDIYVTAPNLNEAKRIARTVIEEKLGACANIHPITSIYRWRGNIEEEDEYALLIKTKTALVDDLVSRVRDLHSYETPCIVSFKIDTGNQSYLSWIEHETL
ncbi:MAG: divalent-cation tolerance protein CutA [Halobacteriota archaeon]